MLEFAGYPCGEVDNGQIRVGYLLRGGLRLSHVRLAARPQNLLIELPRAGWETPNGYFKLLGGHRLWVAPERVGITYLPEPDEIDAELIPQGVRLTQPTNALSGIQKCLEIELLDNQAGFVLSHTLVNRGEKAITAAAWAISQFPLGGIAALPQPDTRADEGGYLPNRSLALWPYTRLNDPRLRFMERYLMVNAYPVQSACKIGYSGLGSWGVYLFQGVLIRKRVVLQSGVQYPDMQSTLEIYVNQDFIELESLSPLVTLEPGEQVRHTELWELEGAGDVQGEVALAEYLDGN